MAEGAKYETVSTAAGDLKYQLRFRQFRSLDEWREVVRTRSPDTDPEEALLSILNAAQKQGATQGGKQEVRKAMKEKGDVKAACASHAEVAEKYIIGTNAPRAASGGITKKRQHEFGERVTAHIAQTGKMPTQADVSRIAEELGIDPEVLAAMNASE